MVVWIIILFIVSMRTVSACVFFMQYINIYIDFHFSGSFAMADEVSLSTVFGYMKKIESNSEEIVLPKIRDYEVKCLLGQGKTSEVFEVKKQGKKEYLILKVAKRGYDFAIEHECNILNELTEILPNHAHLQSVQWEGSVSFREKECSAIITSPTGVASNCIPTQEDAISLVDTLYDVHSHGFLHRDITPGNIGFYENNEGKKIPYLRDFGFSLKLSEDKSDFMECGYQGTIITASESTLIFLSQGRRSFPFSKRDDLESLWKSLFLIFSGRRPFVPITAVSIEQKAAYVLDFSRTLGVDQRHQAEFSNLRNKVEGITLETARDSLLILDAFSPPSSGAQKNERKNRS